MANTVCETKINGFSVLFPEGKKPFPPQLAVISKVLKALKDSENALLESPTGTGKTLAFLTSTLSWQRSIIDGGVVTGSGSVSNTNSNITSNSGPGSDVIESKVIKEEPNVKVEKPTTSAPPSQQQDTSNVTAKVKTKLAKNQIPKVFFCTRTHSQLKQIVNELHNCHCKYTDNLKMVVLGSRNQTCVNHQLKAKIERKETNDSLEEACRKIRMTSCQFGQPRAIKPLVKAMSKMTVWDIEDAVNLGNMMNACPYYATKVVYETADFVLAPYNYIIDARIREAMGVNLAGSVVVFDEAHNIEDVCREAGSAEMSESMLKTCEGQLKRLSRTGSQPHKALLDLVTKLLNWIQSMDVDNLAGNNSSAAATPAKGAIESNGWTPNYRNASSSKSNVNGWQQQQQDATTWDGNEILDIFEDALGLTSDTLRMYEEYFKMMAEQEDDMEALLSQLRVSQDDPQQGGGSGEDGRKRDKVELEYEKEAEGGEEKQGASDEESNLTSPAAKKGSATPTSSGNKKKEPTLSPASYAVLKGLLTVFSYMLRDTRVFAAEYCVVLQRVSAQDFNRKQRFGQASAKPEVMLNFWCMSGSVVFREIHQQTHSVLLTSGTLSPLDSFASELGAPFPVRVEASHVINVATQLFVGAVSTCTDVSLNSTYLNQDSVQYQDAIGMSLMAVSRVTPGGVLMFLPSYALLNKLYDRWNTTGLLGQIQDATGARTFFEPRDSKTMNEMLVEYYNQLDAPRGKAILVAVCRGKVSEGINFSDHYARAVLIVGIPFPHSMDAKVQAKKKFQNRKAIDDLSHVNGDEWYRQQAFRAVNQAIGRCIRHKNDYGAIFLLDPRFQGESVMGNMSRWMRSSAVNYQRLEDALLPAKSFFNKLLPLDSEYLLTYADFKARETEEAVKKAAEVKDMSDAINNEGGDGNNASKKPLAKRAAAAKKRGSKSVLNLESGLVEEVESVAHEESGAKESKRKRKKASKDVDVSPDMNATTTSVSRVSSVSSTSSSISDAFKRMAGRIDSVGLEAIEEDEVQYINPLLYAGGSSLSQSELVEENGISVTNTNGAKAIQTSTSSAAAVAIPTANAKASRKRNSAGKAKGVASSATSEPSLSNANSSSGLSLLRTALSSDTYEALCSLVRSWDWVATFSSSADSGSTTVAVSLLPAALPCLRTEWLASAACMRAAAQTTQDSAPPFSTSKDTAPHPHRRSVCASLWGVSSEAPSAEALTSLVVMQPVQMVFPAINAEVSLAPDSLADSRRSQCGNFLSAEHWCRTDGAVYRLLYVEGGAGMLLLAAQVVATNSDQTHLMNRCFALRELSYLAAGDHIGPLSFVSAPSSGSKRKSTSTSTQKPRVKKEPKVVETTKVVESVVKVEKTASGGGAVFRVVSEPAMEEDLLQGPFSPAKLDTAASSANVSANSSNLTHTAIPVSWTNSSASGLPVKSEGPFSSPANHTAPMDCSSANTSSSVENSVSGQTKSTSVAALMALSRVSSVDSEDVGDYRSDNEDYEGGMAMMYGAAEEQLEEQEEDEQYRYMQAASSQPDGMTGGVPVFSQLASGSQMGSGGGFL